MRKVTVFFRLMVILLLVSLVVVKYNNISVEALSPVKAVDTYKKDIIASARKTGVWASVTAAQLILESGNPMSKLATKDNNFFGIKWSSKHKKRYPGAYPVKYSTKENYTGVMETVKANFTHFPSPSDGITEHSIIWWNGYYKQELKILYDLDSTMDEFLREMANGPYATDPAYYSKLRKVIDKYDLEELDKLAFPEGRQFCGFGGSSVGKYKYPDDGWNATGKVGKVVKSAPKKSTSKETSKKNGDSNGVKPDAKVDGLDYIVVNEEDIMGMYPESFIDTGDVDEVILPSEDSLSISDRASLMEIRDSIISESEWSFWDNMRVVVVFMGLCLLVYALFFGVAYFFDRSNNFIEVSIISILSLGLLSFSDIEDTKNWKCVNKNRLIKIEISLIIVGFFLVGGGLADLILDIYYYTSLI